MLYLPEHHASGADGMIYEHILIAEQILGRNLKQEEEVHHEDRNRNNNSPENLFVFRTKADHSRYHKTNIILDMNDGTFTSPEQFKITNCLECNLDFVNIWNNKYCSQICSNINKRVVDRPSQEALTELLEENSFVSVGILYGVSDNAVRKWCASYGMPTKASYYKKIIPK